MGIGWKDTDQLQDSDEDRREMEWEGTKEDPTMRPNWLKKKKSQANIVKIFRIVRSGWLLISIYYIVLCTFLYTWNIFIF